MWCGSSKTTERAAAEEIRAFNAQNHLSVAESPKLRDVMVDQKHKAIKKPQLFLFGFTLESSLGKPPSRLTSLGLEITDKFTILNTEAREWNGWTASRVSMLHLAKWRQQLRKPVHCFNIPCLRWRSVKRVRREERKDRGGERGSQKPCDGRWGRSGV